MVKIADIELGDFPLLLAPMEDVSDQPCSVRFVNDKLNEKREVGSKEIGYTTTLKLMQIMTEKGMLDRKIEGRKHTYTAVVKKSETQSVL